MTLDIPYEIGEYKKHREDPNHETVCKDSWVCDYLSKYVAEVERLKVENEGLLKHFRLVNGTVTCHNLKKIKNLREALEDIRVEASARKETAIIARIDEALKGDK